MTGREQPPVAGTVGERARRRARLDAVFGEVLPETTTDERDDDVRRRSGDPDTWLREQVPPHHG